MEGIKKKLLEELVSKLSEMDDPLMGMDSEECEDDSEEMKKGGGVKIVKVEAGPMDEKFKKKLKGV